ncbi:rhamnan synthesis F family protein [Phreatobacter sp. AB_2022a]|uniref:rhamnan synthesis F family protein n=1 Tax=Phreatobacter sp. AB_2022a TaxID=3003134 RepID=UPI0022870ED8|nr:rhamnan synthesis F family protein [Phreatobacter sp. AB_2022a]MCZ0732762.1 lipopolysaccharide biosynthesis protein [Phreatobacter sp. AB_2022a]
MGSFLRRLKPIADRIVYHSFCFALKVVQTPSVLRDATPVFSADEIIRPADGDVYAIVLKYGGFTLGDDFRDLLSTLQAHKVNIIAVVNGNISDDLRSTLKQYAHRLLVRENIGRDFGGYRAATLHLHREGLKPGRILYCNDSVAYIKGKALEHLVRSLSDSRHDVVGSFENHEFEHHVGSYVFSISGNVFCNHQFQKFWERYRPYDIRPYAIKNGEIALSRVLKRCGYSLDVVYSAERLAEALYALDLPRLTELIRYTRPAFRLQPLDALMTRSVAAQSLSDILGRREESEIAPSTGTPTIAAYAARRKAARAARTESVTGDTVAERLACDALVDRLMMEVTQGSQIHLGFGLFHRVLDAPLIKKDLLARAIYLEHDCTMILERLPADARAAIMRELVNRGRPLNVHGFRRFLLKHGLI